MEHYFYLFCMCAPIVLLLISNYLHGRELAVLKSEIEHQLQLMQNRIDVVDGTCVKIYDKHSEYKWQDKHHKHKY